MPRESGARAGRGVEARRGVSVKTGFSHPQKVFSTSKRAILRQWRSDKDKLRLPLSRPCLKFGRLCAESEVTGLASETWVVQGHPL